MSFKKLSKNTYVVSNAKIATDVIVTFGDASYSDTTSSRVGGIGDHVAWGEKDRILHELHELASDSPNKWRLLKTRRDFIIGLGLQVLTRSVKNGKEVFELLDDTETQAIEDWLDDSGYSKALRAKAIDYCYSGRYFLKIVLGLDLKVAKVERIDVFHCRPAKMEEGQTRITKYLLNGNFGTKHFRKADNIELPAFDPENPAAYAVSVLDVRDVFPGQVFHPFSEWWGTKRWTKVTNKIPTFHDNGLDNGYNIKYHISFPDDYFVREEYEEGMDETKLKEQVLEEMGNALAGVENAEKVLITYHRLLADARFAESGVKITPLDNKMSDDAYTNLFNTANVAQASGHGVLPSLAGIDTGGKLGGSGKELEAAANYQQGFLTFADRELLVEDLYYIKKIMGWNRNKFFKFQNIQLYNFDVTPAGASQNPNNKSQTSKDEKDDDTN
jgi:hypothetical protein